MLVHFEFPHSYFTIHLIGRSPIRINMWKTWWKTYKMRFQRSVNLHQIHRLFGSLISEYSMHTSCLRQPIAISKIEIQNTWKLCQDFSFKLLSSATTEVRKKATSVRMNHSFSHLVSSKLGTQILGVLSYLYTLGSQPRIPSRFRTINTESDPSQTSWKPNFALQCYYMNFLCDLKGNVTLLKLAIFTLRKQASWQRDKHAASTHSLFT